MNILFLSTGYYPHVGGKSSHIAAIMKGVQELGHTCSVFSYTDLTSVDGLLIAAKKMLGLPSRWRNYRKFIWDNNHFVYDRFEKALDKWIQGKTFDVIAAEDPVAALVAHRVTEGKIPVTLTMHSYFGRSMGVVGEGRYQLNAAYFEREKEEHVQSLNVIQTLIAVDNRIQEDCKEVAAQTGHADLRIVSISNFVDTMEYAPERDQTRVAQLREKYQVPEGKTVITCIRRLCEKNGVIFGVRSLQYLPDHFLLLVGGDGDCREAIENEIRNLGLEQKVRLLGSTNAEQTKELYAISDYVLVPSITLNGLQEATSISALEAMSFEIPTVVSSIGGLKQMITEDVTGKLVPEQDPEAIAQAVRQLSEDPEKRLSVAQASRAMVCQEYSHTYGAAKYIEQFQWAIENFRGEK